MPVLHTQFVLFYLLNARLTSSFIFAKDRADDRGRSQAVQYENFTISCVLQLVYREKCGELDVYGSNKFVRFTILNKGSFSSIRVYFFQFKSKLTVYKYLG